MRFRRDGINLNTVISLLLGGKQCQQENATPVDRIKKLREEKCVLMVTLLARTAFINMVQPASFVVSH